MLNLVSTNFIRLYLQDGILGGKLHIGFDSWTCSTTHSIVHTREQWLDLGLKNNVFNPIVYKVLCISNLVIKWSLENL